MKTGPLFRTNISDLLRLRYPLSSRQRFGNHLKCTPGGAGLAKYTSNRLLIIGEGHLFYGIFLQFFVIIPQQISCQFVAQGADCDCTSRTPIALTHAIGCTDFGRLSLFSFNDHLAEFYPFLTYHDSSIALLIYKLQFV